MIIYDECTQKLTNVSHIWKKFNFFQVKEKWKKLQPSINLKKFQKNFDKMVLLFKGKENKFLKY